MEGRDYLETLFWQIMVFALIGLAGVLSVWLARRYRRWLARRMNPAPRWAGLSAWGVGLALFPVLALAFGFVLDHVHGM